MHPTRARWDSGKKLPAIGRVDISIIEESNPRFLAFDSKQLDLVYVPSEFVNRVIANDRLKPEYASQGIQWTRAVEPSFTYTFFNMNDPTIGGYTPEKLRCGARSSRATTSRKRSA